MSKIISYEAELLAQPSNVPRGHRMIETARQIVTNDLSPLASRIDRDGYYPEHILRKLGRAGAFAAHTLPMEKEPDLHSSIQATAIVAEECLSTAFCMWCQNTCGWYLYNTDNQKLRNRLLSRVALGFQLAGTGLSNPVKALSGLDSIKLKGKCVPGGYIVNGSIPFISNLGSDHPFGIIFQAGPDELVMALASCALPGVKGQQNVSFCALEGTRTWSVRFQNAFIPDDVILSAPLGTFAEKIRPGFILMQTGLAIGLVRSCIRIMRQYAHIQSDVNNCLDEDPNLLAEELTHLENATAKLCLLPQSQQRAHILDILDTRLMLAELGLRSARGAMLFSGARGFLSDAAPQRKLREAYFLAILTPSIRQLRHDIKCAA